MAKFPLFFDVEAEAGPKMGATWSARVDDLPPITSAIPTEFGGPGNAYSPEDLFGLAVISCIIATFKVYTEHANVSFETVHAKAKVTMDKSPAENNLALTAIDITIDVKGSTAIDKVKQLLEKAIKDCAVSNSIKSGKTFHLNVS